MSSAGFVKTAAQTDGAGTSRFSSSSITPQAAPTSSARGFGNSLTPRSRAAHVSPATATQNPSPSRKPTPASKSPGPEAIASTDQPSSTPITTAAAYRPSSAIRGTSLQPTEISTLFG